MARRMEKRKRPKREDKPLSAVTKITDHVFDNKTMEVVGHLRNNKVITGFDYPISEGKEAVVFKARSINGDVAVKVFKYETSTFLQRSMAKYIQGDPRFPSMKLNHRGLVKLWSRKEFSNLRAAEDAGVSAPKPIKQRENIVVMEFLGQNGISYTLLKDYPLQNNEEAEIVYEAILENLEKFWRHGFVHADLNEFNIMTDQGKVWFIDFAQAVRKEHPLSFQFLEKDCENIAKFFKKRGVDTSKEEVWKRVTGN